jgi:hypothetical protein|tara:strand:+ start:20462 stop:20647 length:186 start_codon:yes stop_codon:yes gene_type:complete
MVENNGMTSKELIMLVIQGQREINQRIDELHEKTNTKLSKSEFFSYTGVIISFAVLLRNMM